MATQITIYAGDGTTSVATTVRDGSITTIDFLAKAGDRILIRTGADDPTAPPMPPSPLATGPAPEPD